MAIDDIVYGLVLILCIPFGLVVRWTQKPVLKELLCGLSGLAIVALICREHTLHSLCVTAGNTFIIWLASKNR